MLSALDVMMFFPNPPRTVVTANWADALYGSNLLALVDFTDTSKMFTDTSATIPVTADLQTVKAFKNKAGTLTFTAHNGTGWVYHANAGKPYLAMDGTEYFETPSIVITDGSGQLSIFATVSFNPVSGAFVTGNLLFGALLKPNSTRVDAVAYSTAGAPIGESINFSATITADAPIVMSQVTSTASILAQQDNVGTDSTAVTGTLASAADALHIGFSCTGKLFGLCFVKAPASSGEKATTQTNMAALH
jgi:hypothetical protein